MDPCKPPTPTVLVPDGVAVGIQICAAYGTPAVHCSGADFLVLFSCIVPGLGKSGEISTFDACRRDRWRIAAFIAVRLSCRPVSRCCEGQLGLGSIETWVNCFDDRVLGTARRNFPGTQIPAPAELNSCEFSHAHRILNPDCAGRSCNVPSTSLLAYWLLRAGSTVQAPP